MSTKTALHREAERQAPRFDLVRDLTASIRRHPADASSATATTAGTILNLSAHGLSLATTVTFEKGESLEIEIHSESRAVHLVCLAAVLWCRREAGDDIGVGCELKEEIDESCLDRLSAAGFLDRRQDRRLTANLLGHGKSELNGETHLVRITDYSRGGMRFYTSDDVELGQRLLIKVDESHPIVATPIWKYEVATGHFVGCSFDAAGKAFKLIQEAVKSGTSLPAERNTVGDDSTSVAQRKMSGWVWSGALVVILAGVAFTFDWIPRERTQVIRHTLRDGLVKVAELLK